MRTTAILSAAALLAVSTLAAAADHLISQKNRAFSVNP